MGTTETMISYLSGTALDATTVLTGAGVGYEVTTPQGLDPGSSVDLFVRAVGSEHETRLFGFANRESRSIFDAVTAISGVGPRMAVALLAHHGWERLSVLLTEKDHAGLTAPGVGPKTARKIVDSVKVEALPTCGDTTSTSAIGDTVAILTNLGFGALEARSAAEEAHRRTDDDTSAIREALSLLRAA